MTDNNISRKFVYQTKGDRTKAPAVHLHRLDRGNKKTSTKIMKTSDIEERFWDAFFSGEYDPELYAEYFGLQNSDKETAKETATQTQTKTVTRGIYNRVPAGNGQFRHDKVGETVANYIFEVVDAATLRINGKAYRVEDNSEFAIKVMKTKVKANGGAKGLVKFLTKETLDSWELKIIDNCKPINLN